MLVQAPARAGHGTLFATWKGVAPSEAVMEPRRVDKTKVDPLTGAEEEKPASPLETVPPGQPATATTAVIPGTGKPVPTGHGKVKRVVNT